MMMMQCVISHHTVYVATSVVPCLGVEGEKTLLRNTAHQLHLYVLSNALVVASNTHIICTTKGQDKTLINIRSSQFISPLMLISFRIHLCTVLVLEHTLVVVVRMYVCMYVYMYAVNDEAL
jgi:hypothetical protein